jgi:hypothetical protein
MEKTQSAITLPQPKNTDELELLKNYSSYIMEQLNETKLHSAHKEDIKEILLKAMVEIVVLHETRDINPKTQNFLYRMLHKTTG